jgi:threonyl-tRNA synthetase
MKTMTPLDEIRHSAAHILATAVLRKFPSARLDIGPPTDVGFYYDFDLEHRFTAEDLENLEKEMAKVIEENQPFERREVSREEAESHFRAVGQPYKISRLGDIPEGEAISLYQNGEFVDLCAGTHVARTGEVSAFKLLSVAGAYYRGDEKNKQLQRIYGTAFPTKEELDLFLQRLEEAKLRDHRKLGHELHLFQSDSTVGSGLPVLLPRGAIIRRELEKLITEKLDALGYWPVYSPHIGSIELYKTSGHYPYYAESMYETVKIEEREFLLKPMNCPMHIQAYLSEMRSYRDLPQKYAEFGTVYRREQSGELNGLVRVRGFTQDDGHIFCTPEQLKDEFKECLKLVQDVMAVFGLSTRCRVSLRSEEREGKYVGSESDWNQAENIIQEVVQELSLEHTVGLGEAAFYGPKLDFMALDSLNRGWQLGTIQVDFSLPERFELEYVGADGQRHRPVMIHRAVFGSIERFMGLMIEHYAGAFPVWVAPEQARILPINDQVSDYAHAVAAQLKRAGLRVTVDERSDKIGGKIRRAQTEKTPYMLVVGGKEKEAGTVAVRSRAKGDEGPIALPILLQRLVDEVRARS